MVRSIEWIFHVHDNRIQRMLNRIKVLGEEIEFPVHMWHDSRFVVMFLFD